MNHEAVTDMLVAFRTQQDIISNLTDLIKWHNYDPCFQAVLESRRAALIEDQRETYFMLSEEHVQSLEITDIFYDMYQYITVDPPHGIG